MYTDVSVRKIRRVTQRRRQQQGVFHGVLCVRIRARRHVLCASEYWGERRKTNIALTQLSGGRVGGSKLKVRGRRVTPVDTDYERDSDRMMYGHGFNTRNENGVWRDIRNPFIFSPCATEPIPVDGLRGGLRRATSAGRSVGLFTRSVSLAVTRNRVGRTDMANAVGLRNTVVFRRAVLVRSIDGQIARRPVIG